MQISTIMSYVSSDKKVDYFRVFLLQPILTVSLAKIYSMKKNSKQTVGKSPKSTADKAFTITKKKLEPHNIKPEKQPEQTNFATYFASIRKEKGITQQELQNKTGYDKRMISRWESGSTTPSVETAAKLAKALNVSLDQLTGNNKTHSPDYDSLCQLIQKLNNNDTKALLHIVKRMGE